MRTLKSKIEETVSRLKLNLKGKVVLTEAATGAYVVTPIIAAIAGAKVYAYTKGTRFGSVEDVKKQTTELLNQFKECEGNIEIVTDINAEILSNADVITNSGHLRPLSKEKLIHTKKGLVIPMMYEAWEWREEDLNLNFCRERQIKVGATNERHPDVDVFNYLGDMALKMIFDAGLCPNNNTFLLICNNDFGPFIAKTLSKVCGGLGVCDLAENKEKYKGLSIDWMGNFPDFSIAEKYKNCEAVIFTAYPFVDTWIGGEERLISIQKLYSEVNSPFILRYAGHIDEEECKGKVNFYPEHVKPGHMGILPSAIGFDPIIRLQVGGLKAAQLMLDNECDYNGEQLVELINS